MDLWVESPEPMILREILLQHLGSSLRMNAMQDCLEMIAVDPFCVLRSQFSEIRTITNQFLAVYDIVLNSTELCRDHEVPALIDTKRFLRFLVLPLFILHQWEHRYMLWG
jgi:hypothetical protein